MKPVIVLVRPQLGQNIGKAARAMLNFGLTEMRLVSPRDGWPNPEAGPAASGADDVLAQAAVYATVAEAIADCSTVFASTVRRRDLIMPAVGPEEMAATIHSTPGRTAILFGPERSESKNLRLAARCYLAKLLHKCQRFDNFLCTAQQDPVTSHISCDRHQWQCYNDLTDSILTEN